MDNLQYWKYILGVQKHIKSFKPYYKWIIFNIDFNSYDEVLDFHSFKPYYKWIIFNIFGNYDCKLSEIKMF